jgi:integral membrane protein (TIGR01906 family)
MKNKVLKGFLYVIVAILVLFVLLMGGVRLLLTDTFLEIEYGMDYFPEDTYGFSQEDRLEYAPLALDYLLNSEDISFLGDQTFEDGSPLYNQRELRHMEDVKILTQQVLSVWNWSIGILVSLGIWAYFGGWWKDYRKMLSIGGLCTIFVIATIVLLIFINFNQVFTGFHSIFFEGDTWLFKFSDTLIRLFPLRFWQDAFIFVGFFAFVLGLLVWWLTPQRNKNSQVA